MVRFNNKEIRKPITINDSVGTPSRNVNSVITESELTPN